MTNAEHNDKVLAQISAKLKEIDELKATMLPVEAEPTVTLAECNAGARDARMASFEAKARIKAAVSAALVSVPAEKAVAAVKVAVVEGDAPRRKRRTREEE